ncbi:hypothetical protein [Turneriella parva]|uniref:Uncharacterized protein n=1 Tax=Turneriella parva (strain ATCC BAA-1111 / DSM 21527 / NCTC 11395 / H) TaxID=869212 RepID=I4B212_TURPD|nr:hypothetical protein [Turneriella parva]AFM11319.1 hypothetical protein Turpa_0667 [Turneriella parva DSM 21527]
MAGASQEFASLLRGISTSELEALKALPWQAEKIAGEAVAAKIEPGLGVTALAGALPFLETRIDRREYAGYQWLKSEQLAGFLALNRALLRCYLQAARAERLTLVGNLSQARLYQVSTETVGMSAASFAVFLAQRVKATGAGETLLVDLDTTNQFVFPLLRLPEAPPVLTEQLQKPSSFKADLQRCILKLANGLSYLNMQATSLRPFSDAELARIVGTLDADFDSVIIYSGRLKSAWLSANAEQNYAITDGSYKSELAALIRHSGGLHTVLMAPGRDKYQPHLNEEFARLPDPTLWQEPAPHLNVLQETIEQFVSARRLTLGARRTSPMTLDILWGINLYFHYAREDETAADKILNKLQKKMSARYPGSSFFSQRSALKAISILPQRAATTLLSVNSNPMIVSLPRSAELRALAIFPAGVIPAVNHGLTRIAAAGAATADDLMTLAARSGFNQVLKSARITLQKPNALAAVLEQVQP